MKAVIARVKTFLRFCLATLWGWIKPEPTSWKGAGNTALALGLLVYAVWLLFAQTGPLAIRAVVIVFFVALGALSVLGMQLIALLIGWLNRLPYDYRWKLLGGIFLLTATVFSLPTERALLASLGVMLLASLLGGSAWLLWRMGPSLPMARRTAAIFGGVVGAGGLVFALLWFTNRGIDPPPQARAAESGAPLARVSLENPASPGPYRVATLTYGSGSDRYRPEFGSQAALITKSVDGSALLSGTWSGLAGTVRPLIWGFGRDALPLNGRVWYPQAGPSEGPFPLVLVVHGNHTMQDFSDPGYEYLGELLASRGFILVSLDQNFLNGGFIDLIDPTRSENDARGWLMLEHLRVWHAWNQDPASPFYGKVDAGNIGVMGHSRGGEAAALAAAFNQLPAFPENANQVFDYGYQIKAVVAIAPIDGQYWPVERGTRLDDVSYLVLHGTHDADVNSFDGINQFERVRISPNSPAFKAGVYIYRANHGQFNAVWGDSDYSGFVAGFINRKALMNAEEQQQVAQVYISAFLEASLKGEDGYRPLFQDARAAQPGWLPTTILINRYAAAGEQILAGFEEDINLHTGSAPGSTIEASGLAAWSENRMPMRWGGGESGVVILGWNEDQPAEYTIHLPPTASRLDADGALIFNLADALRDPQPKDPVQSDDHSGPRQPIDLTVALVDAAGQEARLPLSMRMPVQPQLVVDVWKVPFNKSASSEAVLQSYAFALAEFVAVNPDFDPTQIRAVRFVFDRTPRGSLILDGVGFRNGVSNFLGSNE